MKEVWARSECGSQHWNLIAARTVDLKFPAWISRIILKLTSINPILLIIDCSCIRRYSVILCCALKCIHINNIPAHSRKRHTVRFFLCLAIPLIKMRVSLSARFEIPSEKALGSWDSQLPKNSWDLGSLLFTEIRVKKFGEARRSHRGRMNRSSFLVSI